MSRIRIYLYIENSFADMTNEFFVLKLLEWLEIRKQELPLGLRGGKFSLERLHCFLWQQFRVIDALQVHLLISVGDFLCMAEK